MDIYQNIDSKLCNRNIDTIFDLDARLRRKPALWVGEPKATQLGLKKGYLSTRWKVDRNKSVHRGGVGVSIGFQFDYNS